MLYFKKSQPAPDCLETEKSKSSGDYKCGCVLDRLKVDFQNKCYICEVSQPHSINVEHFRPHKGDANLKFSWENIFLACSHCNNIKLGRFANILDCTNVTEDIENKLSYQFIPFPFEKVKIEPLDASENTRCTASLVESSLNGTTKLKKMNSANIRNKLLEEMQEFQRYLTEYFKTTCDEEDKCHYKRRIKSHLHKASNFTSFKRCVIKNNSRLNQEFSQYLEGA